MASINASTAGVGGVITTADNTGILNLQTAGTTAISVDTSRNVIVNGTTAYNNAANRGNVTIEGATTSILNLGVGGTLGGYVYHNGTDIDFRNAKTGSIQFATTGIERMRLDSSGNLGIGTASPATRLETAVSNPTRGVIAQFTNSAGSGQTGAQITLNQTGVDTWTFGMPAGASAISFWNSRSPTADGTSQMSINNLGNLSIAGALSFASFLGGLGKTGSFIRNSGSASGTQAITGVGFRPSTIIFFAAIDTVSCQGIGFTDATNGRCVWIDNVYGSGGASYAVAIYYLRTIAGNGASHTAVISSMDADGFTLNWTRTNIGSGGTGNNITVNYLAFR